MKKIKTISIILLAIVSLLASCTLPAPVTPPEIDYSNYPFYVKDYENMEYVYDDQQIYSPYWLGNVIYNESVVFVEENGIISGKLLYKPLKIVSVRDYSLKAEYSQGADFTVSGSVITLTNGSAVPYLTANNLLGKDIGEPFRKVDNFHEISNSATDYCMITPNVLFTESALIYGNQLAVTYVYDVNELPNVYKKHNPAELPKTLQRLNSGDSVNITLIGDSISEGCSASSTFNHEPFLPIYGQLITNALMDNFDSQVNFTNLSKGGQTAAYGTSPALLGAIKSSNPDLFIIAFGMNDGGAPRSANVFIDDIGAMVAAAREKNPDCEIILVHTMPPNPDFAGHSAYEKYLPKLDEFSKNNEGTALVNMWQPGIEMLKVKRYIDISGNNANHPNDFLTRVYAMNILSAIIDFK